MRPDTPNEYGAVREKVGALTIKTLRAAKAVVFNVVLPENRDLAARSIEEINNPLPDASVCRRVGGAALGVLTPAVVIAGSFASTKYLGINPLDVVMRETYKNFR